MLTAMSLLLNIDTSTETAFVSLTNNETIIAFLENDVQKEHAAFIHPAIKNIMQEAGKSFLDLDAVSVTAGPGSYTGIRVGMATAKGLCFALNKPFITLNTLEISARDVITNYGGDDSFLYCPMIDARRMEVYTAIYSKSGKEILSPSAVVINPETFRIYTTNNRLVVFGSGASKCKSLSSFNDVIFTENVNLPKAMALISYERFSANAFNDVVFSDPFYLKEFFNNNL